jgi:hypothetical protein
MSPTSPSSELSANMKSAILVLGQTYYMEAVSLLQTIISNRDAYQVTADNVAVELLRNPSRITGKATGLKT